MIPYVLFLGTTSSISINHPFLRYSILTHTPTSRGCFCPSNKFILSWIWETMIPTVRNLERASERAQWRQVFAVVILLTWPKNCQRSVSNHIAPSYGPGYWNEEMHKTWDGHLTSQFEQRIAVENARKPKFAPGACVHLLRTDWGPNLQWRALWHMAQWKGCLPCFIDPKYIYIILYIIYIYIYN